ncbi:MAG: DNA mismatch repair endonuclease MutH [Polyangiaceae bacterium]
MALPERPGRTSGAPHDVDELVRRAADLEGRILGDLARELGLDPTGENLHAKGKAGTLLERALGATAGNASVPDFVALGIELKTIPVTDEGRPHESTFVCSFSVADADRAEWDDSSARAKLARVLWVPVIGEKRGALWERRIGRACLWSPTAEQEAVLRADFEDLAGAIGAGGIESVTAHDGRWLQLRPKARDGSERTIAFAADGDPVATIPRGFYLRARFTEALLRDPSATPP